MKKSKAYYAIAGTNGYGICRSWDDCNDCLVYFKSPRAKKFDNPDDAYDWINDELSAKVYDRFYIMVSLGTLLRKKLIFFSKQKRLPWEY